MAERARIARIDAGRRLAHGRHVPRTAEMVMVDPTSVAALTTVFSREASGLVVPGTWDDELQPLDSAPKVRACQQRFIEGLSWEDTGIYDYMSMLIAEHGTYDGCATVDDVVRRYQRIDDLFDRTRRLQRLCTRRELGRQSIWERGRRSFRERGGVYVHIGAGLTPIFGAGGYHRLAIAQILELPLIPAQVGVVHAEVVTCWRSRFGPRDAGCRVPLVADARAPLATKVGS